MNSKIPGKSKKLGYQNWEMDETKLYENFQSQYFQTNTPLWERNDQHPKVAYGVGEKRKSYRCMDWNVLVADRSPSLFAQWKEQADNL